MTRSETRRIYFTCERCGAVAEATDRWPLAGDEEWNVGEHRICDPLMDDVLDLCHDCCVSFAVWFVTKP